MTRIKHVSRLSRITLPSMLALMFLLQGCPGGGSSGPVPDADPTGYYTNTGTATVKQSDNVTDLSITDLQAIVYNNRIMVMSVANGLLYDGTITSISQNSFTATFTIYTNGANPIAATASGTITQGSSISGTLTGTGAGNGTFTLTYANTNNQIAAISRVENTTNATWGAMIGGGSSMYEFIIDNAGVVVDDFLDVGGVFHFCEIFNGEIIPITGTNLYQVTGDLRTCADVNVRVIYTGFAATRSQTNTDDTLVFMMTSGSYGFYGDFQ